MLERYDDEIKTSKFANFSKYYTFKSPQLFNKTAFWDPSLSYDFRRKFSYIVTSFDIDLIFLQFPFGSKYVYRHKPENTRLIVDFHNFESFLYQRILNNLPRIIKKLIISQIVIQEKFAMFNADYIITVSRRDLNMMERFFNYKVLNRSRVIPNLPSYELSKTTDRRENAIVFHGHFDYPPNQISIDIIRNLAKQYSDLKFVIFGPGKRKRQTNPSNLIDLGIVENPIEVLVNYKYAIVPMTEGSGTRLKIIEYAIAANILLSSKKGVEGLNLDPSKDFYLIDPFNFEIIYSTIQKAKVNPRYINLSKIPSREDIKKLLFEII